MKEVKEIIAENIARLRTSHNLTQNALAEKLNYTDKSVSKWEHGETTPPIEVLIKIAGLFGVSVDYLITESPDENYDKRYNVKSNNVNKLIITLLATSLIWLAAIIMHVYGMLFSDVSQWIIYVFAVPASFLVLLIFNCIWGKRKYTFILISCLIWSVLASVYIHFITKNINPWAIFLIGIPLQIAVILWSQLKTAPKKQ